MKAHRYLLLLVFIGALVNSPAWAAPLDQDVPSNADQDMTMPDMTPSDMKMLPVHTDQDSANMRTAPKETSTKVFDPKDAEPLPLVPQGAGPKDMGAAPSDTNGIVMDEPAPPPPPPVSEQDICTTKECAEDLKASGPNTEE